MIVQKVESCLSEIVQDYNLDLLKHYIISNLDAYYSLLKTNFDDLSQ